jgi:hypothetical protein
MNGNASMGVEKRETWMPIHKSRARDDSSPAAARAARAESLQRSGKKMVIAGFVITIVGVIAYCAVTFAGGKDADMGDVLFRNAVPFAWTTLGVLGLGVLVWLIGSFTYLRGVMDADDEPGDDGPPASP